MGILTLEQDGHEFTIKVPEGKISINAKEESTIDLEKPILLKSIIN